MKASALKRQMDFEVPVNIVDVRERDEFQEAHIEGAANYPLSEMSEWIDSLNPEEEYIVLCLSGARSTQATWQMEAKGYKVANIEDGLMSWPGEVVKGGNEQ
ncbi:rhodanese-like domain-containing protein [Exiguobacterium sp. s146]|uniref:rhodanese-like domain-containing protein n=1 Tax=Exiguobacterium sp. s146 TaxID=2751223 RepID=UPI001BEAC448|nr:rhodanese-like domain-containing protein [Exiguobacterium sp. s146]